MDRPTFLPYNSGVKWQKKDFCLYFNGFVSIRGRWKANVRGAKSGVLLGKW